MKSLAYLLLLLFVRSLLVLALVLWAVGQNVGLLLEGDLNRWSCSTVVGPSGYLLGVSDPIGLMWEYSVVPLEVAKDGEWLFEPQEFDLRRSTYRQPFWGVGVVNMPDRTLFAIRHQTAAAILLVVNVLLQIIQWRRKRKVKRV